MYGIHVVNEHAKARRLSVVVPVLDRQQEERIGVVRPNLEGGDVVIERQPEDLLVEPNRFVRVARADHDLNDAASGWRGTATPSSRSVIWGG